MSDGSDGSPTGPMGHQTDRPGKPPVPRPVPSDPPAPAAREDGQQHRTEQVPYPLPPLPPQGVPGPAAGPATGRLYLGGYPPRVPGGGRPRPEGAAPADAPEHPDRDPGGTRDDR
jgi:hypothetical protein